MFKKKTCKKCKEKISSKFEFCPYCGNYLGEKENGNWGMLGKKDSDEIEDFPKMPFGNLSGKMINKMLGSALKMLEREMKKEQNFQEQNPRTNFELFINGKRISPENIKVTTRPKHPAQKTKPKPTQKSFSKENLKKFLDLPKQEPSTNVRRFSDRVVYEIQVPGVVSIQDILINKLENSIEIKALSKDKAYKKILPVNLPLIRYKLDKDLLVLELKIKE